MSGRMLWLTGSVGLVLGLVGCAEPTSPAVDAAAAPSQAIGGKCIIITSSCYLIQDLGTLSGGNQSSAAAINDSGTIVGSSNNGSGQTLAFRYRNGVMSSLPLLTGATAAAAVDINRVGDIVGNSGGRGWFLPVSILKLARPIEIIPTSGGGVFPAAVNNQGLVVGSYHPAGSSGWHAFKWTQHGGFVDINPAAYSESGAKDVTDAGVVVGYIMTAAEETHAFRWTSGSAGTDLGTLGGASSSAIRIDSAGVVVGTSSNSQGSSEAFKWTATGGMVSLGAGAASTPTGFSNPGRVAGTWYPVAGGGAKGFTLLNSAPASLPNLTGAVSATAAGVNQCGVVVGQSYLGGQVLHAVLWSRQLLTCQP